MLCFSFFKYPNRHLFSSRLENITNLNCQLKTILLNFFPIQFQREDQIWSFAVFCWQSFCKCLNMPQYFESIKYVHGSKLHGQSEILIVVSVLVLRKYFYFFFKCDCNALRNSIFILYSNRMVG